MWVGVNLNRIITGCECLKTVVTTSMIFPSLRLKVVQRPSKSYLQKRWKLNRPWGSVKMQKKAIVAPCQRKNSWRERSPLMSLLPRQVLSNTSIILMPFKRLQMEQHLLKEIPKTNSATMRDARLSRDRMRDKTVGVFAPQTLWAKLQRVEVSTRSQTWTKRWLMELTLIVGFLRGSSARCHPNPSTNHKRQQQARHVPSWSVALALPIFKAVSRIATIRAVKTTCTNPRRWGRRNLRTKMSKRVAKAMILWVRIPSKTRAWMTFSRLNKTATRTPWTCSTSSHHGSKERKSCSMIQTAITKISIRITMTCNMILTKTMTEIGTSHQAKADQTLSKRCSTKTNSNKTRPIWTKNSKAWKTTKLSRSWTHRWKPCCTRSRSNSKRQSLGTTRTMTS